MVLNMPLVQEHTHTTHTPPCCFSFATSAISHNNRARARAVGPAYCQLSAVSVNCGIFPPKFNKINYTPPPIAEFEPAIFAVLCSRRVRYFIFNRENVVGDVVSLRLIDPAAEFFLVINLGVLLCYLLSASLLHMQQKS